MSKARALREQRKAAQVAARDRKAENRARAARDRARKLANDECRHCSQPIAYDQATGKKLRMCNTHLDLDAARKRAKKAIDAQR